MNKFWSLKRKEQGMLEEIVVLEEDVSCWTLKLTEGDGNSRDTITGGTCFDCLPYSLAWKQQPPPYISIWGPRNRPLAQPGFQIADTEIAYLVLLLWFLLVGSPR